MDAKIYLLSNYVQYEGGRYKVVINKIGRPGFYRLSTDGTHTVRSGNFVLAMLFTREFMRMDQNYTDDFATTFFEELFTRPSLYKENASLYKILTEEMKIDPKMVTTNGWEIIHEKE